MTLYLYVLRQLLISVGFSLAGIAVLVVPSVAIQAIATLGGIPLVVVLRYLPLVLVELVPYLLPMVFLLGVVAAYGRLEADRELTAVRMAGIHPGRLLLPGLTIAIPLVLGTNRLLATTSPQWKFARRTFARQAEEDAFKQFSPSGSPGEWDFGKFSLSFESGEGSRFDEVLLNLPAASFHAEEDGAKAGDADAKRAKAAGGKAAAGRGREEELTIVADSVERSFEGDMLVLRLSQAQVLSGNAEFESAAPVVRLSMDELLAGRQMKPDEPKYRTSAELSAAIRSGEVTGDQAEEFRYHINFRNALSFTYLVFLLLGLPTGALLRTSTQLSAFAAAVGYALLYYVLALRLGKELASVSALPVAVAAWSTDALFLLLGSWLTFKALWR